MHEALWIAVIVGGICALLFVLDVLGRELLRKASLFAADDGGDFEVKAKHFDEALHEMIVEGGDLTKSLLGAASAKA